MRLSLLSAALLALVLASSTPAADKETTKTAREITKLGKVEVGKPAPDVSLPAFNVAAALPDKKDAKTLTLKDFEGKKNVVLFFFPKAMTGGCTKQCKGFTALAPEFAKLDTVAIGISTDPLEMQEKFTSRDKLGIPLFADADKEVAKTFGVLNPTRGMANRVTFVIDKKGIVRQIHSVPNAEEDPAKVLEYVKKNLSEK